MERKWTPGPWHYFAVGSVVMGGEPPKKAPHQWKNSICVVDSQDMVTGLLSSSEHVANAHLIAAAPDLYEALEAVNNWFEGADVDLAKVLAPAQAALAKARGEA